MFLLESCHPVIDLVVEANRKGQNKWICPMSTSGLPCLVCTKTHFNLLEWQYIKLWVFLNMTYCVAFTSTVTPAAVFSLILTSSSMKHDWPKSLFSCKHRKRKLPPFQITPHSAWHSYSESEACMQARRVHCGTYEGACKRVGKWNEIDLWFNIKEVLSNFLSSLF